MKIIARAMADADHGPPTLAARSSAPDFCLPGVDGQNHCLKEYTASKILHLSAIAVRCPSCTRR